VRSILREFCHSLHWEREFPGGTIALCSLAQDKDRGMSTGWGKRTNNVGSNLCKRLVMLDFVGDKILFASSF